MWLVQLQKEQYLEPLPPKLFLPCPKFLVESAALTKMLESSMGAGVTSWTLLLSSWTTREYTLLMEGRGSINNTWVLTTENWSFKPVIICITWSSKRKYRAERIASHLHWWIQVQRGIGLWELSSSHRIFISVK